MSTDQSELNGIVALSVWAAGIEAIDDSALMERASDAMADTLACALAGREDEATRAVARAAELSHGAGHAALWGMGRSLSMAGAALVNGTAAHALDFDDNFEPSMAHASAVLVPSLLAMASGLEPVAGKHLLTAYIIGIELQARIGHVMHPDHYRAGWHATSTLGTVGAAGACAWLAGADSDGIAHAMSLAFSQAAGSKLQFGSQAKPTHAGLAARAAVTAAMLAKSGLGAKEAFATGPWSFAELYNGNGKDFDIDGLGKRWALLDTGLMVKRFPCCAASHRALDGIEAMINAHGFGLEDIAEISVELPDMLARNLRYDAPETEAEARFSLSYPVLLMVQKGSLSLFDFTAEALASTPLRTHFEKVRRVAVPMGPEGPNMPNKVTVTLADGKILQHVQHDLVGSGSKALNAGQKEAKLSDCLTWAKLSARQAEISSACSALESSKDILTCLAPLA